MAGRYFLEVVKVITLFRIWAEMVSNHQYNTDTNQQPGERSTTATTANVESKVLRSFFT